MKERLNKTPGSEREQREPEQRIDRRSFFRGAAGLSVGGVASFAQLLPDLAFGSGLDSEGAAANLAAQTQRALRWAGQDPANWVRPRPGVDNNVVIVGGGQSGVAIAYGLRRKGIGQVEVIDQADPGQAGIWRTVARMRQLRTPKTLAGPSQGNPALSVHAWYEALHGRAAFDQLDRVPRLEWAAYLDWLQQVGGVNVRYRTRLVDIEPVGDLLRLHLDVDGVRRTQTTRKLVLASGYTGVGGPGVPGFIRALPAHVWTHSGTAIQFHALASKRVGVIGAGSSAFDAATAALEAGAAEVHLYSRRAFIDYTDGPGQRAAAPSLDRGHANVTELAHELPDEVLWRNYLLRGRRVASVPFDTLNRTVAFKNFHLHLNSPWSEVGIAGDGTVVAKVAGKPHRFDHVIAATGYAADLSLQPEFGRIHQSVALWADRYQPQPGEQDIGGGRYPYLGRGFEFLPRHGTGAEFLRNIHCYNMGALLSFGIAVGDIPSAVYQSRLISAIARDLFLGQVDATAHKRCVDTPQSAPDPAPYLRAIRQG